MKKQLLIFFLLILNISCKIYKTEKVYFFDDTSKSQPVSIKLKIPQRGLINRQEVSATSLIDRQINYFYRDSSLFYINTDIPALGYIVEDKSGIDDSGLYWHNLSNKKIIIGYKNASKERKAEFDKVIESVVAKLEN